MLHINSLLQEKGFLGRLFDMTLPETYFATGISDFWRERRELKPTSYMRTFGYTLPFRPGGKHLLGRTVITFFNVKYLGIDDSAICLYDDDIQRHIYARVHDIEGHCKTREEQGIMDEDTVQLACILYDPRDDSSQLIAIRKHLDMPAPDLSRADIHDLMPALGFS
ncbi:MAG: hypothetical protein QT00_C0001G0122 [archaeon GW2011_AR5]|nr:MAG: hypothetical protein QT00_C0001G0122 [archaeon GW2011_AR5]